MRFTEYNLFLACLSVYLDSRGEYAQIELFKSSKIKQKRLVLKSPTMLDTLLLAGFSN